VLHAEIKSSGDARLTESTSDEDLKDTSLARAVSTGGGKGDRQWGAARAADQGAHRGYPRSTPAQPRRVSAQQQKKSCSPHQQPRTPVRYSTPMSA